MFRGKNSTKRETSISVHETPAVSAAQPCFPDENDFNTSLLPASKRYPLLDHYLNDAVSPPADEASISFASYWSQIRQQQQIHRDLMDRHQRVLSQLREVVRQAQSLRQENVNLKMVNLDLNNRLNFLLGTTSFQGIGPMKMGSTAAEEEGTSEKSPTSVMDSGRVRLPKSISVRSSGYLKSGRPGNCVKPSNPNKQKVYVDGGRKEQLELEVYNQGMIKTELCNKWQQTGECPYGDNCQFAHGIDELRPVIRHPRYKTEVCRMMLNGVTCPYGHRCHFRHTLTDEERVALEGNFR